MPDMFYELEEIIQERKENPKEGSYTNRLLDLSLNKISQKVGEEAVEVIVAALGQGRKKQIGELADLAYHTLVLMSALNITLEDVSAELRRRHEADVPDEEAAATDEAPSAEVSATAENLTEAIHEAVNENEVTAENITDDAPSDPEDETLS